MKFSISNDYVKNVGIHYEGVVTEIKKSKDFLQPIYEAFTNSLEAISLLSNGQNDKYIKIRLYYSGIFENSPKFESVEIEDNGVGFDEENFLRMITYKDFRKGFNNKGSGRIQLIHFFDQCDYTSIFREGEIFKERSFSLSKRKSYLEKNSIIFHKDLKEASSSDLLTKLKLKDLLNEEDQNYFGKLTLSELKQELLSHYILYFCAHRTKLPLIEIELYVNNQKKDEISISDVDIPPIDKIQEINLHYSALSDDLKTIKKLDKKETFELTSFKIEKSKLDKNSIKLTSKHEIRDHIKIELNDLAAEDTIEGNRFLFLLSGKYIEDRDSDTRGEFRIPSKEDFKKGQNIFQPEEILIEDIQTETNHAIKNSYPEISENSEKHKEQFSKLKEMFLLNDETIEKLSFSLNDTEESILSKVYSAEAKVTATRDAEIKNKIDKLDNLNPSSESYENELAEAVIDLVKQIPLQNRTALTHYVARRQLVLELFDKILQKNLKIQRSGARNMDEKLLHNLIFQQTSNNPENSDLWLVNEDFIYFKGASENRLDELSIDGEKILKENLTEEEEEYRLTLGEDRFGKRPDVLLFPSEGKCIIIEFKAPNVNISDHLNQINKYASLILNLTKDKFRFNTFYGYLLGEKIDGNDVRAADGDFKHATHFDYVFRPSKTIVGMYGRQDGSLYTEVIKYSTLLKRAIQRNLIFKEKILKFKEN